MNITDIDPEEVDAVIEKLVEVTETNTTAGRSIFARDLNTTNSIVSSTVQYLTASIPIENNSSTLLELNEVNKIGMDWALNLSHLQY